MTYNVYFDQGERKPKTLLIDSPRSLYYLSLSSLISCSTSTCAGCFLAEDLFGLFLFPPFSSSKNPASSSSSGTNSSIFVDECDHPFCGASIKMSKTSC